MRLGSVSILYIAVFLLGCAIDPASEPAPQHNIALSLEPVGRFVRTDRDFGYRAYSSETDEGREYLFDDEFHPPGGLLRVDCGKTEQLGVWLNPPPRERKSYSFRRSVNIYSKQPRVDVQWTHSARPEGDTRYRHGQFVNYGYRFIVRYNLTKKDKVDGTMALEISHGDNVLYSTSFQLEGCELPDREQ